MAAGKGLEPKQEAALVEFREAVACIPNKPEDNDQYYLRWLRARKYNVQKALLMFKNHMDCRARFGIDTILEDWVPPEVLTQCFPGGFFGEDRSGHPVWYDFMGNLDFRGLQKSVNKEDILKYKCMHMAQCDKLLKEKSIEKGYHMDTVTSVIDFENLSFKKHYYWPGLETLKAVLSLVEANCPERIEKVFIVRAPSIFPVCYNIVKHIFDESTRRKIFIFGSNWKEELQKYISPDQLPQVYGGTRCEPDSCCTDYINPGCDVPPKFFFENHMSTNHEDMERVVVSRAHSHTLTFDVVEVDSLLTWEFVSTDHDIGFGVFFLTKNGKKEMNPVCRCDSHLIPQVGQLHCKETGKYVAEFDNTYSWTRSKEVFYSIKVISPSNNS